MNEVQYKECFYEVTESRNLINRMYAFMKSHTTVPDEFTDEIQSRLRYLDERSRNYQNLFWNAVWEEKSLEINCSCFDRME